MINENSIMATTNPFILLAGGALVCLLAYVCARKYHNTNDFKKSVMLYFPGILILDVVLVVLLNLSIFLTAALDICGFIALALISNYYFYH